MKRFTVLIPLDGSAFSEDVLATISGLFDPERWGVLLMRVADAPVGVLAAPPKPMVACHSLIQVYESTYEFERAQHPIYADQMEDTERANLVGELERAARCLRDAGFDIEALVRFGEPAAEIVDVAAEAHVDLITMATHGRSGLERLRLGSVAEAVLRRARQPLLLLHPTTPDAA